MAFIFSFLILLASIAIWIFAIRAIQHYNRYFWSIWSKITSFSPECVVPLTISEVDSPVPLEARCRTGYVPIGQVKAFSCIFDSSFPLGHFSDCLLLNQLCCWHDSLVQSESAPSLGELDWQFGQYNNGWVFGVFRTCSILVGCLTLFDLVLNTQYRSLWSMHTSERGHANRISFGSSIFCEKNL